VHFLFLALKTDALFQARETGVNAGQAFVPRSTVRFAPVMYQASGLATNATRAAT